MDLYCASLMNEPLHPSCSESASTPKQKKFARGGGLKEPVLDPALFTDGTVPRSVNGVDGVVPWACLARQFLSKWPFFLQKWQMASFSSRRGRRPAPSAEILKPVSMAFNG